MKLFKLSFYSLILFFAFSCSQAPKSDEAQVGEAQAIDGGAIVEASDYQLNTNESSVSWVGTKPIGKHNGAFKISEGVVKVKDGAIVGGTYLIDVASLKVLDMPAEDEMNAKLSGHLKSGDFFDVEKYPTAKFEITSVEPYKSE